MESVVIRLVRSLFKEQGKVPSIPHIEIIGSVCLWCVLLLCYGSISKYNFPLQSLALLRMILLLLLAQRALGIFAKRLDELQPSHIDI